MKIESKIIINSNTIQNIIDVVNQYKQDIQNEFDDISVIEITSIKIDIKNNKIYIIYNDYTEEQKQIENIIKDALTIKTELVNTTDEIERAELLNELAKLSEQYTKLTGNKLSEVI